MFVDGDGGRLNKQDRLQFGLCGAVKMLVLGRPSHDVSQVGVGASPPRPSAGEGQCCFSVWWGKAGAG